MAMNNLPGFNAELRDGGLTLSSDTQATTESILLLGTAVDGPVKTPVPVRRIEDAERMFGKVSEYGVSNGATLLRGLNEAWKAGGRDIRLMRVSGEPAVAEMSGPTTTSHIVREAHETLGLASGNMEFTFVVAHYPFYEDQISVYANGFEVSPDRLTLDAANGTVTIAANAVNSESEIHVRYTYPESTEQIATDEVLVSNDQLVYISQNGYVSWDESTVSVKVDGVLANEADYTVDGVTGAVTFSTAVDPTSSVTADFTYHLTGDVTVTESTDTSGSKWVAVGAADVFDVTNKPAVTSVLLYANGLDVHPDAFSVNADQKKIILKPGFVDARATITVAYTYRTTKTETPKIALRSVYGGKLYNRLTVAVEDIVDISDAVIGKKVIIEKPAEKRASIDEKPLEYSSIDYPTFLAMANAINQDTQNNVVVAEALTPGAKTVDLLLSPAKAFIGGDDGMNLSKDELYRILEGRVDELGDPIETGIYDLLKNYRVDHIVLLDGYADDVLGSELDNFAYQLAKHCAIVSAQNNETFGWIGCRPLSDIGLASINENVRKLAEKDANTYHLMTNRGAKVVDSYGNPIDIGRYIAVFAAPEFIFSHRELGRYYANGAAAAAGLTSTFSPQSAPTNKTVPGAEGLRYTLSPSQLELLTQARYLTARTKFGRGVVITDGVTAADPVSDYARISTMRITNAAVAIVREEAEPYIGEPNEPENRNAMAAAIQAGLDAMKRAGALTDFQFAIHASLQDQLLGRSTIELKLVPVFETRQITIVVSLSPSL